MRRQRRFAESDKNKKRRKPTTFCKNGKNDVYDVFTGNLNLSNINVANITDKQTKQKKKKKSNNKIKKKKKKKKKNR